MRSTTFTLALSALTAGLTAAQATAPHQSGGKEYVVILDKDHPTPPAVEAVLQRLDLHTSHPDVRHVYNNSAFRGFAASMKSHCIDLLTNMTEVSVVEETVAVTHAAAVPSERRGTPFPFDSRANAPWGLQTISTATMPSTANAKELNFTYSFANTDLGTGADIYVVDTGLYAEHIVFGNRAKQIWSFDGNSSVVDGHGTHTAGTAGGASLGVASNANVFGVRALSGDGTGWSSDVVAGIDYVVQQHDLRKASASTNGHRGSVMSISLASGKVDSLDQAVSAAIEAGVHTVVAAGNAGTDACGTSPAASGGTNGPAITVGSVGITGKRSSFSNIGSCVDIYAPGEDIISAWLGAPDMVNVLSGTSMATPHVAGIVAYATANQTLANDTGLMKEWIRMQGHINSEGIVVANNGVLASSSQNATAAHRRDVEESEANEISDDSSAAVLENREPTHTIQKRMSAKKIGQWIKYGIREYSPIPHYSDTPTDSNSEYLWYLSGGDGSGIPPKTPHRRSIESADLETEQPVQSHGLQKRMSAKKVGQWIKYGIRMSSRTPSDGDVDTNTEPTEYLWYLSGGDGSGIPLKKPHKRSVDTGVDVEITEFSDDSERTPVIAERGIERRMSAKKIGQWIKYGIRSYIPTPARHSDVDTNAEITEYLWYLSGGDGSGIPPKKPHKRSTDDFTITEESELYTSAKFRYVHSRTSRNTSSSLTSTGQKVEARSVKSALQSAWDKVKGAFQSAWSSVKNWGKNTWDKIKKGADDKSGHLKRRERTQDQVADVLYPVMPGGFSRELVDECNHWLAKHHKYEKRALGDGLNSLVAFFANIFGGNKKKPHTRRSLFPSDADMAEQELESRTTAGETEQYEWVWARWPPVDTTRRHIPRPRDHNVPVQQFLDELK